MIGRSLLPAAAGRPGVAVVLHSLVLVGYSDSGLAEYKPLAEAYSDIVTCFLDDSMRVKGTEEVAQRVGSATLDEAARPLGLSRSGYGVLGIVARIFESALEDLCKSDF